MTSHTIVATLPATAFPGRNYKGDVTIHKETAHDGHAVLSLRTSEGRTEQVTVDALQHLGYRPSAPEEMWIAGTDMLFALTTAGVVASRGRHGYLTEYGTIYLVRLL